MSQMLSEARAAGLSTQDIADIQQLSRTTSTLVASHFTDGFDALARLQRESGDKPWARTIQGEYSGALLRTSIADLRRVGRARFDNVELIWDYDAPAVLERLTVPLLWVLAEDDREAPIEDSRRVLSARVDAHKPFDVYQFPRTDHGMFEYTQLADGSRRSTRITDGYLKLLGDWIKGNAHGSYGSGVKLESPAAR